MNQVMTDSGNQVRLIDAIGKSFISIWKGIGENVRPGSLKGFVDIIYVIVEKLSYEFPVIMKRYLRIYDEMIKGEINLLSNIPHRSILIVGAGALPATAIVLAQKLDTSVVGIDRDESAVKKAEILVRKMGFDPENLSIVIGDGIEYPLSGFDVVFLLYGIREQRKMLEHVAEEIDDEMRVMIRATCDDDGRVNIDEEMMDLSESFSVDGHSHSSSLGPVESYLLSKKDS